MSLPDYKAMICEVPTKEETWLGDLMEAIGKKFNFTICQEPTGDKMAEVQQGFALYVWDRRPEEVETLKAYCEGWLDCHRFFDEQLDEL
jgi:hypothetical protein